MPPAAFGHLAEPSMRLTTSTLVRLPTTSSQSTNALTDLYAPSYPAYYLIPRLRAYSNPLNTLFQDIPVLESAATQRDWPRVSHTC